MAALKRIAGFKKILLPTDFTASSETAARYALTIAKRFKSKVYVIHVVETMEDVAGFYVPHLSFDSLHGEMIEGAASHLKRFCAKRLRGFTNFETVIKEGKPYQGIVEFAEKNSMDLIVIGSMGRTRMDRLLSGSTTDRVLRKAHCPVLAVPPAI